ncbi:hypothetical protein ACFSKU_02940 [Pontibacter silvestris]|uniref:Uncharacterized protein n=1 Tax=Pontibacter silvestris TaxID=2305183 RepID=A0ABW4WSS8_9BACT|nr:hypothetical protein [Pontibacter silvestris]MCC9138597.1 hypothetical protein [Pontibacter silvestris]
MDSVNKKEDYNPSIAYEYLVMLAFNCPRNRDPFGLAYFGIYDDNTGEGVGHDVKFGVSAAIRKVANDSWGTKYFSPLMQLDRKLWKNPDVNKEELNQIIDEAHQLFAEVGVEPV